MRPRRSTGATVVRSASGSVLVVSRVGDRREYVAAFNAGERAARVTVATATPSSRWQTLLGPASNNLSLGNGRLALEVPALSALLLRADAEVPLSPPARPGLRAGEDDLSSLVRLTATVLAAAPVSVTFAVRRANAKRWTRLGVDDSPPYRAFLDPVRYRRGERVHLVAVVRAPDGRTAVSKVLPFRLAGARR